jgi:hypothetical protein
MSESRSFGWVDGERVPLSLPADVVWPGEEPWRDEESPVDREGAWWPSEGVRRVRLEELSRAEAGQVSDWARGELVYWLAGDGLHPVRWLRRWTMVLWRYVPGAVPGEARLLFGSGDLFERGALEALFARGTATREKARLESVWRGLGDRCAVRSVATGRLEDLEEGERALSGSSWDGPDEDRAAAEGEAAEVARLALVNLAQWLAADGGWCLGALKRFYTAIFVDYKDLAPRMTGEDFGAIYGQTRAAFCEDVKRYIGLPLELELGYRPKVAGQKRADAAAGYADNAREHCPRRQLGPEAHEEEDRRARSGMDEARVREAREAAEERELERAAREMEEMARRNRERGRVRR